MLLNKLNNPGRLQFSVLGLLLGVSFALYVYRFPLGGGNITLLRVTMILLGIYLLISVANLKRRISGGYWALLIGTVFLIAINFYYYSSLDEYPIPQREIVSHSINLFLMLQIVLLIDSREQLILILHGFIFTSLVAISIGYFGFFYETIPFESILREYGSESAVGTSYIIQDGDFFRLSGAFMDPNFFGIYLLTVLIFSTWLYVIHAKNNFYLLIAGLALTTLFFTLSRTAMIGLLVFGSVYIFLWQDRWKLVILAALGFLVVVATVGIVVLAPALFDRLLNTESAGDRVRFISKGIEEFVAHPLFGSGVINIIDDETGIATAHLMYITVLAKFGIFGACAYFLFIFYPILNVIFVGRRFLKEYRIFIFGLYVPLFAMYFLYDFLMFLEFQYLIFAIGYSVALSSYSKKANRIGQQNKSVPNRLIDSHDPASLGVR